MVQVSKLCKENLGQLKTSKGMLWNCFTGYFGKLWTTGHFNFGESALLWEALSDKIFVLMLQGDKRKGNKKSKLHIAFLFGAKMEVKSCHYWLLANISTHAVSPQNKANILVDYKRSEKAHMTSEIFEQLLWKYDKAFFTHSTKWLLLLIIAQLS